RGDLRGGEPRLVARRGRSGVGGDERRGGRRGGVRRGEEEGQRQEGTSHRGGLAGGRVALPRICVERAAGRGRARFPPPAAGRRVAAWSVAPRGRASGSAPGPPGPGGVRRPPTASGCAPARSRCPAW